MTSVVPMGRYAQAIRRLTGDDRAAEFYDVHVAADAEHEVIAADRLAAGFVRSEPEALSEVLFGARAVMAAEARLARHLVAAWTEGRSSLRSSLRTSSPAPGNGDGTTAADRDAGVAQPVLTLLAG